jgi:hypothetical protein
VKPNIICGPAALVLALALLSPEAMAQDKAAAPDSAATPATTSGVMTAKAEPAETAAKTEAQEAKRESVHPFAAMAGSWSGGGTISLQGGARERLRCRARHIVGDGDKSLGMSIRCASDTYKFELTSNVSERGGQISGSWSEASNAFSGSISGRAAGNHISAVANGDGFTAGISVTTNGNRQSVSIVPQGVYITGVQIALSRR